MAPQFNPDGHNGQSCPNDSSFPGCDNSTSNSSTSSSKHLNTPMLALGLSLAAFLLICLIVCACTYRSAKARNRATRTLHQEIERGEYVGLGLGLHERSSSVVVLKDEDKESKVDEQAPPAYTPKVALPPASSSRRLQQAPSGLTLGAGSSSPSPLLSLTPSPALAAPVSPALSSYSLSPALSQGENEEVGLLGGERALTPPPPTYVR